MKKIFTIAAAAAMLFGAASCQKEITPGQKGDCKVTFNVEVPDEVVTKAQMSDGTTVDELVYEVYVGEEVMYEGTVDPTAPGSRKFVLELNLVSNQTYDLLFWAQKKGTGYYNTYSLKNVTLDFDYGNAYTGTKHYLANDEKRDAFCGSLVGFEAYPMASSQTVKLYRPLAQINFASSPTDWNKAQPFIKDGLESKMVLKNVPTAFNVATGDVASNSTRTLTLDYAFAPASEHKDGIDDYYNSDYIRYNGAKYGWIAMAYVFAPKEESTMSEVSAYFVHDKNEPSSALSKTVYNVPFKKNYRTNILGEIFTGGNTFTIVIEPGFDNDPIEDYPDYIIAEPLMFAFEHGGSITLTQDIDIPSALTLSGNKELIINLNGCKITPKTELWDPNEDVWSLISVQDGASLTINGNDKPESSIVAKADDSYVFDVRGGTLTINGGSYSGNISAVYVEEGTANINGGHFSIQQLSEFNDWRYTLNCYDANYAAGIANINVTGGSFVNFDPSNNLSEGPNTNYVTAGTATPSTDADGKVTYTVSQ